MCHNEMIPVLERNSGHDIFRMASIDCWEKDLQEAKSCFGTK